MKDEIKEILNKLLEYFKESNINDFGYEKDKLISYKEAQILLDYITNLQEKNEILKKDIEAMKHNYNLLVRIIENGESMTQKFENGLTYQDYKSRNEKALDKLYCYGEVFDSKILQEFQKEMENILNGGD